MYFGRFVGDVMLFDVILVDVMLCDAMLFDVMLVDVIVLVFIDLFLSRGCNALIDVLLSSN